MTNSVEVKPIEAGHLKQVNNSDQSQNYVDDLLYWVGQWDHLKNKKHNVDNRGKDEKRD